MKAARAIPLVICHLQTFYIFASASPFESRLKSETVVHRTWTEPSNVNVGPGIKIKRTKSVVHTGLIDSTNRRGLPKESFTSAREGRHFNLTFDLPPGTYQIYLGFAELRKKRCKRGGRVFHVYLGDKIILESFDIFASSGGCFKAITQRFYAITIDPVMQTPIILKFQGVAGPAILNHVRVKRSKKQCKPETHTPNLEAQHLAHAVPGVYPPRPRTSYVDTEGKGFVSVLIDGTGSHTHFFTDSGAGRIKSYIWTFPENLKLISTKQKFRYNFPLGTTRLKLKVVDTICSSDEAETSITVTSLNQPGQYCYYYEGLTDLPEPGTLLKAPHPSFAAVSPNTQLDFPTFPFRDSKFVARCVFFVQFEKASTDAVVSVGAGRSGKVRVYMGLDLIVDLETSAKSVPISFSQGMHAFEVIYMRTRISRKPVLKFLIDGNAPVEISYDQATVLPIINVIDPAEGPSTGGGRTKLQGIGLFLPLTVNFGSKTVRASVLASSPTSTIVYPPSSSIPHVNVSVVNGAGYRSNSLAYSYGSSCDPIGFQTTTMDGAPGLIEKIVAATSIALWQSGILYIGTRSGVIYELTYESQNMRVINLCSSEPHVDDRFVQWDGKPSTRSVLGITFDPRDTNPKPYASVSSLFWDRTGNIERSNPHRWSNGNVERFVKKGDTDICIIWDKTIVKNLPVSDGDHAVNELVFTQNGDLLIGIGGFTNSGLPFENLGGNWGTYFSGAVVRALLSLGNKYNGVIEYDTPLNLRTAKPISGDVVLHATGLRNMFSMIMARDGTIYGMDMGANCGFGNASSSCSEYVESAAAVRDTFNQVPFPGKTMVDEPTGPGSNPSCVYGGTRLDKLVIIKEGKFYGHANIPRAVLTKKPGECIWIDPYTGKSPRPQLNDPPPNFEKPLALFPNPILGMREYGSNVFCGRMRGDFVFSRYGVQPSFRARRTGKDVVEEDLEELGPNGGLRVEENVHGDLIHPRVYGQGITVLRPIVSSREGFFVGNALPVRHGRDGGKTLTIGGWGFRLGVEVFVGEKRCALSLVMDREIDCLVPAYGGGSESVDVIVKQGALERSLKAALLYMAV